MIDRYVLQDALKAGNRKTLDEIAQYAVKGDFIDVLYHVNPDGSKEIIKTIEDHNLIVTSFSTLVAAMLFNLSGPPDISGYNNNLYWAWGSGDVAWDTSPFTGATEVNTSTKLVSELGRVQLTPANGNLKFINDSNVQQATPTNRLEVTYLFSTSQANGNLREFGLFGGLNSAVPPVSASVAGNGATAGGGLMINHKKHGLIVKTSQMEMSRTIRLTL